MMRTTLLATTTLVASTIAFGCEKETPITPDEATEYVAAWAPTVEQALNQRSEGASVSRELKSVIVAEAAREEAKSQRDEPPYDSFVKEVYEKNEYQPKLVLHGKLTPAGEAVWTNIQQVADHALDPEPYHLAQISASIENLDKVAGDFEAGSLEASDAEKQWAVNWLTQKTHETFELTEATHEQTTDAMLESAAGERLKTVMKDYEELGGKLAADSAKLEWMLAHDFAKFSRDVGNRHVRTMFLHPRHDDYYNDPEIRQQSERPPEAIGAYKAGVMWRKASRVADSMANHTKTKHRRIKADLEQLLSSEKPAEVVASIWPAQPQYRGLVNEFVRYRAIVDAGGWEEVDEIRRLKHGQKKAGVKELKKRLQAEGYYPEQAELTNKFGDDLKKAILTYQTTHQMEKTGEPHRVFWRSLNVSAEERMKQIALNLERWRRSNIRHDQDETYVYVNVPDFTAELWDEGERKMRFEIVVGNNDWVEDEETEEKYKGNRTPLPIAAYIDRAIYNPYWNVTPRVRTNEILPEVAEWVEDVYIRKYKQQLKDQEKYEALRKALGKSSESGGGTTLTSTNPAAASGAAATPPVTPSEVSPEEGEVAGITPAMRAHWTANPDVYPYYNAETGEIDVSTTVEGKVPGWYAENDYEVMHAGKSWEYVRMTPGDHNALGLVKVIFPNLHDVYLHDTNAKPLFKRDIRAFSHGCMRMSEPLGFAEYLLRRDSKYEKNDIPKVLKEGTYLPVFLDRQVPVFVEYHTVHVDDEGRANFLADIYDYDEQGIVIPDPDMNKKPAAP